MNVILFTTMPPSLQAVNLPATAMLSIVMSSRLILNIRTSSTPQPLAKDRLAKTTQYQTGMSEAVGHSHSQQATTHTTYQMSTLEINPDPEKGSADNSSETLQV